MATHLTSGLTREERKRYSRHLTLPQVGIEGQEKLKRASALIVGAGGLGAPVGLYLAAAGVGALGIADFDVVEESNLQRQVIHSTSGVGSSKAESAARRIAELNPFVRTIIHEERLTSANAMDIMRGYDVIVDGTDNFPTRYLTNDACVLLGKPLVYGSVYRFEGQASLFDATIGPCYRCLFPEPPPPGSVPSCEEGGVFGVLPGLIGMIQATETIKRITGIGESLAGRLLVFDALEMRFRELRLRKDPECPVCGAHPSVTELIDYEAFCGVGAADAEGSGGASVSEPGTDLTPVELKAKLDRGERIELVDVREDFELDIAALPYTKWIPLGEFTDRIGELDKDAETIVYCHTGGRSGRAVEFLRRSGFSNARNLKGGITRWSDDVDPNVEKY
ncbi:MAG TPA: molybdopterin-synthase adenylyltransferase MoeB [Candidatus Eremiobacteraceae bacterium]